MNFPSVSSLPPPSSYYHGSIRSSVAEARLKSHGLERIKKYIQGVPKKTQLGGILAITPLCKWLELKVGGVSKTSGNSLCDRHKNFPI